MMTKEEIVEGFRQLQNSICSQLEVTDGKSTFIEESWIRQEGGGGVSRIIENGALIEKGGVNFSAVHGATSEHLRKSLETNADTFFASGVSIVLHPQNPYMPIIHMNIRYFELSGSQWWFGGGIDLTPHYIDNEEAAFFHQSLKHTCDRHDEAYYPKFKSWADDYFYNRHRNETRGIGGIFFDKLTSLHEKDKLHAFLMDVGATFLQVYLPIAGRKRDNSFGDRERAWQLARRGRYVEFNLLWDKGTRFGLETNGRVESILMSLPPLASWIYNALPSPNTPEEHTLQQLKKNIDWIHV